MYGDFYFTRLGEFFLSLVSSVDCEDVFSWVVLRYRVI